MIKILPIDILKNRNMLWHLKVKREIVEASKCHILNTLLKVVRKIMYYMEVKNNIIVRFYMSHCKDKFLNPT